jgi:hypothetical protein
MIRRLFIIISLLSSQFLMAQTILNQANWQQRVDYKIEVALNDSLNVLHGFENILYQNNSPKTITEIYIHLWPNAYLNNETPFAVQQMQNGKTDFYYSEPGKLGKIDSLNFKIDGIKVKVEFVNGGYEICKLTLPKPLGSGSKVDISTSFRVYLPEVFSRMGHQGQLYCVTQWFPKPAVYDINGWNPMSYLDQGEFYSEFGKFDVSITVPKDYVVAATGNLEQQDEKQWWLQRTRTANVPHPSKATTKTLRFVQDSVHDFAWFASKDFKVAKSEVKLKSGKSVDTWLFVEDDIKGKLLDGTEHINTAISFYSDKVGEYPYQHATVVVTPLLAGGGMEYPTITNITDVNRQVIIHEVGHNWFYGILGSNERSYPWMDESINNYYEARCGYKSNLIKYKGLKGAFKSGSINMSALFSSAFGGMQTQYLYSARNNTDQPCTLHAQDYTDLNYGTIIYGKASLAFLQLQRYLGDDVFDGMMRAYYQKWKFKHPLPNDFIEHAKSYTGKNLDWFFNDLMNTSIKPDYALKRVSNQGDTLVVKLKNKGGLAAPIAIQTTKNDSIVFEKWIQPFTGKLKVKLPAANAQRVWVDGREESIDVYRNNNSSRTSGMFKRSRPLSLKPIVNLENPTKKQVFYSPILGANSYNKFMLGMAFYNSILPRKKTEFVLAPMYAFGTKDVTGYFSLQRRFFTQGKIQEMQLGVDVARFGTKLYTSNQVIGADTLGNAIIGDKLMGNVYEKIAPRLTILFKKKNPRIDAQKTLNVRWVMVNEQIQTNKVFSNFKQHNSFLDAKYTINQNRAIRPYMFNLGYQMGNAQSTFQKITAEYTTFIDYGEKKKGLYVRAFAGYFIQKPSMYRDERAYFRVAENNGYYDYMYDELQFGRGQTEVGATMGIFGHQLMPNGSGFRSFGIGLGETDSWLAAANFTSTIPGILPIRVFVDVAAINSKSLVNNGNTGVTTVAYQANLHYVGGVSVWFFKDVFQVNFPIFTDAINAKIWDDNQKNYGERITFTLKLNQLNPIKAIRENKLF